MKLIIDIDEGDYKHIKSYANDGILPVGWFPIIKGTILPKHGRLIDADEVKKNHKKWIGYIDEDMIERLNIAVDKHIPTIIPADEEG